MRRSVSTSRSLPPARPWCKNVPVQQTFPRASRLAKGYRVGQVDAFFTRVLGERVGPAEVRTVGFDLVRGGYQIEAVDEMLDRIEDDLARAERDRARADLGERGYLTAVTGQAQVLRGRLARQHGDRFARASGWGTGYDVAEVDELCDQAADYFDGDRALAVDALRDRVFRMRRGSRAYDERAVDAYLDRVVAVMIKVG